MQRTIDLVFDREEGVTFAALYRQNLLKVTLPKLLNFINNLNSRLSRSKFHSDKTLHQVEKTLYTFLVRIVCVLFFKFVSGNTK